jgi:hypothetical protein
MTQIPQGESIRVVMVQSQPRIGTVVGVLACVFGALAVFAFPIIFVPIALLCAVAGMAAGIITQNGRAFGASLLGVLLSIGAAIKSPTIWLAVGLWALHSGGHPSAVRAAGSPILPVVASVTSPILTPTPTSVHPLRPIEADAIDDAVAAAEKFNTKTPNNMSNLAASEARMHELSDTLSSETNKVQGLSPWERRTLMNKIATAQNETGQIHESNMAGKATFETISESRTQLVEANLATCRSQLDLASYAGCQKLASEAYTMMQNIAVFAARFDAVETTYQQERERQHEMAAAASF